MTHRVINGANWSEVQWRGNNITLGISLHWLPQAKRLLPLELYYNIEDNFIVKAKRDIQFIDGHKMINKIDGKRNIISYFQYNLHLPDVAISLTVTVIAQFKELFVFET